MPFELWNWEAELEMPAGTLGEWRRFDVTSELSRLVAPWPVRVCNDATSACAAELTFGRGAAYRDFAYFYVGAFAGGGVVLNGSLFPGRSGNAGALGSMPVLRNEPTGAAGVQQLIRSASLYLLERRLVAAGQPGTAIWLSPDDWSSFAGPLDSWIDEAAGGLAQAVAAVLSVIDFEAVVIDGAFPADVRRRLVECTIDRFGDMNRQGLTDAAIVEGSVGRDARAIGGAAMPLLAAFARDFDVLFKAKLTRYARCRMSDASVWYIGINGQQQGPLGTQQVHRAHPHRPGHARRRTSTGRAGRSGRRSRRCRRSPPAFHAGDAAAAAAAGRAGADASPIRSTSRSSARRCSSSRSRSTRARPRSPRPARSSTWIPASRWRRSSATARAGAAAGLHGQAARRAPSACSPASRCS